MDATVEDGVLEGVRSILRDTLHLGGRAATLTRSSGLFGTIPEFDSMAVVEVIVAVEETFAVTLSNDDITVELFETVGNLVAFIENRLAR